MQRFLSRRDFLKVVGAAGIGGTLFSVDLTAQDFPQDSNTGRPFKDFRFVQLSDTHWGFNNPAINPDFAGTLKKTVAQVNALENKPDFIVFTGDLTHTTDDDKVRRERMKQFREIIKELKVQDVKFLAGEHDAALDNGEAFKEVFGKTHYTFDHKGAHFIALDNVSDPRARLGDEQLAWLSDDLKRLDKNTRIIVLTHRPLFDLAADWDWNTSDGSKALELLAPFIGVAVLYGHIHQVNHHTTANVAHHSATGLMYPLPAPHSVPKKAPIKWDAAHPYKGLGYRQIDTKAIAVDYVLTDFPLAPIKADPPAEQVVKITAKKFEYSPKEITLKKGVPATLELVSLDRLHGFSCPGLDIRSDIVPGKVNNNDLS
jgi:Icc-related predicted phosphoesterase